MTDHNSCSSRSIAVLAAASHRALALSTALAVGCVAVSCLRDAGAESNWLRTEKFLGSRGHGLTPEHVEKCKDLGLNVVFLSMQAPYDKSDAAFAPLVEQLRASCRRARELGMHVFLGYHTFDTSTVRVAVKNNPRKRVGPDGKQHNAPCLLDPHYWHTVFENRAVILTEAMKEKQYQLDGFLFDIEVYRVKGWGELCYCDGCFSGFAKAQRLHVSVTDVPAAAREKWLGDDKHEKAYRKFRDDTVRQMATRLRNRVTTVRPGMIFGFYPQNFVKTYQIALAQGLATKQQPVLMMPEYTYSGYNEGLDLEGRKKRLNDMVGKPVLFIPGFNYLKVPDPKAWPVHLYEFATRADGYWLYPGARLVDGGGVTAEQLPVAYAGLKRANAEIRKRLADPAYQSALKYRPQWPDKTFARDFGHIRELAGHLRPISPEMAARNPARPKATALSVRTGGVFLIHTKAGENLSASVRAVSVGYDKGATCYLYSPGGKRLDRRTLLVGDDAQTILRQARESGVHQLWIIAGDGVEVDVANRHWVYHGFVSRSSLGRSMAPHFTYAPESKVKEVFFHVPRDVALFAVNLHGKSRVQHYHIKDADGATRRSALLNQEEGLATQFRVEVSQGHHNSIWSLRLESPRGMYTPNHSVAGIPSLFGIAPDRMLVLDSQYAERHAAMTRKRGRTYFRIEAERMNGFWNVIAIPGASGEGAVRTRPWRGKQPGPVLSWAELPIDRGCQFNVWVRATRHPQGRTWCRVRIDGHDLNRTHRRAGEDRLAWELAGEAALKKGKAVVELDVRRNAVDAILVTDDLQYVPTGEIDK